MLKLVISLSILIQSSLCFSQGTFSTGIGHLIQEDYRVDNEINPFPLGINTVPIISYRSENLIINGPRVRYNLKKGLIGTTLLLNTYGDRYKSHELEQRETSVHAGVSLRFAFLSFNYTSDISNVSDGNSYSLVLAHRFMFDQLSLIPRIGQEFLNSSITNYYFEINQKEANYFEEYELKSARNNFAALTLAYKLTPSQSLLINYNFKQFDQAIFDSPTVKLKSYKTYGLFWSILL